MESPRAGFLLPVPGALAEILERSSGAYDLQDYASRLLLAAAVLAAPDAPVPLARDVERIMEEHGADAGLGPVVLRAVVDAAGAHLPPGWSLTGPDPSPEYPMKSSTEPGTVREPSRPYRPSAFGKYAGIPGGSEEYAREKQAEIEREERKRS